MLARMMREHRDATLERLKESFRAEQQRQADARKQQERLERKRKVKEQKLKYMQELQEKRRSRAA